MMQCLKQSTFKPLSLFIEFGIWDTDCVHENKFRGFGGGIGFNGITQSTRSFRA